MARPLRRLLRDAGAADRGRALAGAARHRAMAVLLALPDPSGLAITPHGVSAPVCAHRRARRSPRTRRFACTRSSRGCPPAPAHRSKQGLRRAALLCGWRGRCGAMAAVGGVARLGASHLRFSGGDDYAALHGRRDIFDRRGDADSSSTAIRLSTRSSCRSISEGRDGPGALVDAPGSAALSAREARHQIRRGSGGHAVTFAALSRQACPGSNTRSSSPSPGAPRTKAARAEHRPALRARRPLDASTTPRIVRSPDQLRQSRSTLRPRRPRLRLPAGRVSLLSTMPTRMRSPACSRSTTRRFSRSPIPALRRLGCR